MAEQRFVLTRDGYERLKQELQELQAREQEERERLQDVVSDSDPSVEHAAYQDARTMREDIAQNILYIQQVLNRAEVLGEDPDPYRVDPGDRVIVWDIAAREERRFDLLGSAEVVVNDGKGVSIESPVGQALLGRRVGDVVEVDVPDGKARYAIRQIERIAE
ncbi:MAG: GreA/GreB family elongation factor [Chloroflexi bacterium]|nr:GreA/GreB family elongation factor [Chloroflexota bacterium]